MREKLISQRYDVQAAIQIGVISLLLWVVAIILSRKIVKRRHLYGMVIIALITIEMGWFAHRFVNPEKTESILSKEYPETAAIQYLKQNAGYSRIMLPDDTIGWFHRPDCLELFPNRLMVPQIYTVRGYDQTFLKSYANYVYLMQGIRDESFMNVFLNVFDAAHVNPKMLSAFGCSLCGDS